MTMYPFNSEIKNIAATYSDEKVTFAKSLTYNDTYFLFTNTSQEFEFVFKDGKAIDLNDLIPEKTLMYITNVINDNFTELS